MTERKIAPNLRRFLDEGSLPCGPSQTWTEEARALWLAAADEFRALVAVAKAAKVSSDRYLRMWQRKQNSVEDRLVKTLERLSRVSRPRPRTPGGGGR